MVDLDSGVTLHHERDQLGTGGEALTAAETGIDPRPTLVTGVANVQVARDRTENRRAPVGRRQGEENGVSQHA